MDFVYSQTKSPNQGSHPLLGRDTGHNQKQWDLLSGIINQNWYEINKFSVKTLPNWHLIKRNTDCVFGNRIKMILFSNIVYELSLSQRELIAIQREMRIKAISSSRARLSQGMGHFVH